VAPRLGPTEDEYAQDLSMAVDSEALKNVYD
jgi:hypothetical protein